MGPILPQINVFGKQLGIGPDVMGLITSILPILYVVAKPIVGFLIDYFTHIRKLIFMLVIFITALSYSGFYLIPDNLEVSPASVNVTNSTINGFLGDEEKSSIYSSASFWLFVLLMSLGTINFNVGNCVSDAICFDVLGENQEMKYGRQRVWGTIGFGITALIAGIATDQTQSNSIGPALVVMLIFTFLDLVSVTKLKVRQERNLNLLTNILKQSLLMFLLSAT